MDESGGDYSDLFSVTDLRDAAEQEVSAELERIRREMSSQRAAADLGRMIDVRLTRLPGGAARLHVDFDMLAGDAMSYRIVLDDLAALLKDEPLEPMTASFRQYLEAPEIREPKTGQRDQKWWEERLPELPEPPRLPTVGNVAADSVEPRRRHLFLDASQRAALERNAQANSVSPAACLAGAFAATIGAFSAESKFFAE